MSKVVANASDYVALKALGDYDIGSSNCHHGAHAAFNLCARPGNEAANYEMPNVNLSVMGSVLAVQHSCRGTQHCPSVPAASARH